MGLEQGGGVEDSLTASVETFFFSHSEATWQAGLCPLAVSARNNAEDSQQQTSRFRRTPTRTCRHRNFASDLAMTDFEAGRDEGNGIHFSPNGCNFNGSTATADTSFAMANVTGRTGARHQYRGLEGSRHGESRYTSAGTL